MHVGGSWAIQDGGVGARWLTSYALYDLHTILDLNGQALCGTDQTYLTLATHVCDAVDLAASPSQDDAGAACGALSLGIGFAAVPAAMGNTYDPPANGVDCPDAWSPSATRCN